MTSTLAPVRLWSTRWRPWRLIWPSLRLRSSRRSKPNRSAWLQSWVSGTRLAHLSARHQALEQKVATFKGQLVTLANAQVSGRFLMRLS
jgi:hypothetical protein